MNLRSSDIKAIARDSLRGHWFSSIIAAILAAVFGVFFMSFIVWARYGLLMAAAVRYLEDIPNYFFLIPLVMAVIVLFQFFFGGAVHLGYIKYNLSLLDREKARLSSLFSCFGSFWKAVAMRVGLFFIVFCCSLLLIVPGIIVYFIYPMTPYVLEERPAFPVIEAMRSSRKMMRGNKWKLFCLRFSFIGWDLLCLLTLGLAAIYVVPLKQTAEAVFYNEISGRADVYYGRPSHD
ncbi:MAG: DUF975 family protein [Eubacterium sp.]|nr:DUF975 family protein [Eubacterium sp.]